METLLDELVNVSISVSKITTDGTSFNHILLIDTSGLGTSTDITAADSLSDVEALGFSTESKIYDAARVAFTNGAEEIYVISKLEDETVTDTLNRAEASSAWYAIYEVDEDEEVIEEPDESGEGTGTGEWEIVINKYISEIAAWASDNQKLLLYTADCADGITNPLTEGYNYAAGFATKKILSNGNNQYLALAVGATCMATAPEGTTWAYKTLTTGGGCDIDADAWTMREIYDLRTAGLNYYTNCAGRDIVLDGKVLSGEYIDIVVFKDYLVADIQSRVFKLFVKNPKVPYTDEGIALIETQIVAALMAGQSSGGIAETSYDEDGNATPGYTVSVPTAASVSAEDRAERVLRNCKFTARLTGAIHAVEIKGTLEV